MKNENLLACILFKYLHLGYINAIFMLYREYSSGEEICKPVWGEKDRIIEALSIPSNPG